MVEIAEQSGSSTAAKTDTIMTAIRRCTRWNRLSIVSTSHFLGPTISAFSSGMNRPMPMPWVKDCSNPSATMAGNVHL